MKDFLKKFSSLCSSYCRIQYTDRIGKFLQKPSKKRCGKNTDVVMWIFMIHTNRKSQLIFKQNPVRIPYSY